MQSVLCVVLNVAASPSGNCTWVPSRLMPDPPCAGHYECVGCGARCHCTGGYNLTKCPSLESSTGQCAGGPGPTCEHSGPGKCDVCGHPAPYVTAHGCSECLSDDDCNKYKPASAGLYPAFCFEKSGYCDGECGGGGGDSVCSKKYPGKKPYCVDYGDRGSWCYECTAVNKVEHSKECDPGKGSLHHSEKPFCLGNNMTCASCQEVYAKFRKCPADGFQYGLTCVLDKAGDACFSYAEAPCSAFDGFCPINDHSRRGGACKYHDIPGTHHRECGDA